ncbi:MAG: lysylphosphatidylglycerol synthase transmembrane domain-containing protein, partial [Chloroflexota bacterium]
MKISNRLKAGLLGIIVSALALGFIITQLNLDTFIQAWQQADYSYVVPCLLLLLLGLFTRAARWRVLLRDQLPYKRTFSIMNVAYLVNGVLPFRIGEVARVYLVSRTKNAIPVFETTSTIIVERLLDLLAIAVMVLLALALGPVPPEIQTASIAATVAALVGFAVLIALANWRDHSAKLVQLILTVMPFISEKLAERLHAWFMQFLDGLLPLTKPSMLLLAVGWTAISWAVSIAAGYVL